MKTWMAASRHRSKIILRSSVPVGWPASFTISAKLKRRRRSSKKFPPGEHRRLAAELAAFGKQVPDGRLGDAEAACGFGNANAGIIVNETELRDGGEQLGAFLAVRRLGGQPRRRAREFGPRHFPERERGGVAAIQNGTARGKFCPQIPPPKNFPSANRGPSNVSSCARPVASVR
jgi:hypothetical protein